MRGIVLDEVRNSTYLSSDRLNLTVIAFDFLPLTRFLLIPLSFGGVHVRGAMDWSFPTSS
jgi:hypothetical protein